MFTAIRVPKFISSWIALSILLVLIIGSAQPGQAATMFANGTGTILRGDPTIGDFPGFYGGNLSSFPVPLTLAQAQFAVLGAPDDTFLTLPGRNDTPSGHSFPYAYVELLFPSSFIATGTSLDIYETADSGEDALVWLWVTGGGFIHANATTRNTAFGFSIDLAPLQGLLDGFGPGARFTKVGIGGLDLRGGSQGFDLDAVGITSVDTGNDTSTPEPSTLALSGLALIAMSRFRRRKQ